MVHFKIYIIFTEDYDETDHMSNIMIEMWYTHADEGSRSDCCGRKHRSTVLDELLAQAVLVESVYVPVHCKSKSR